jgi:hypothetical protein
LINLLGVYHYHARSATAETRGFIWISNILSRKTVWPAVGAKDEMP